MYVLSKIVVNSMNNITSAKNGGGDAWHERHEHHRTVDGIVIKSQREGIRKGMGRWTATHNYLSSNQPRRFSS